MVLTAAYSDRAADEILRQQFYFGTVGLEARQWGQESIVTGCTMALQIFWVVVMLYAASPDDVHGCL